MYVLSYVSHDFLPTFDLCGHNGRGCSSLHYKSRGVDGGFRGRVREGASPRLVALKFVGLIKTWNICTLVYYI